MKKFFRSTVYLLLLFFSYSTFGQISTTCVGKITNPNSDSLTISYEYEWGKTRNIDVVHVEKDGSFSAKLTLPVQGLYYVNDGTERATVFFVDNGKLSMFLDTKEFDESINFKGDGALESKYIAEKYLLEEHKEK